MNPPPPSPWDIPQEDQTFPADETPAGETGATEAPAPSHLEACWRCGKWVDLRASACPVCRAAIRAQPAPGAYYHRDARPFPEQPLAAESVPQPIKAILWMFAIMLGTSVVQAWWLRDGSGIEHLPAKEQQRVLLQQLLVFEGMDTFLVVIALTWASRPLRLRRTDGQYAAAWLAAGPMLALLLGINWTYHEFLRKAIGQPPFIEYIELDVRSNPAPIIFAVCVWPAIVEELFFRYLALTHLRSVMGVHGAVWVSSVMFGMAHIHVPLSIPILILVGAGLGYMRVWSGGLAIPMLMHAVHNAVVLYLESKP
jgi:CAAX protease family protein